MSHKRKLQFIAKKKKRLQDMVQHHPMFWEVEGDKAKEQYWKALVHQVV